jgi:hypothetical protein
MVPKPILAWGTVPQRVIIAYMQVFNGEGKHEYKVGIDSGRNIWRNNSMKRISKYGLIYKNIKK